MQNEMIPNAAPRGALQNAPLTEEQQQAAQRKLLRLLAAQTQQYTMGESSSVPLEIAQELLASVLLTLRLAAHEQGTAQAYLGTADLETLLQKGQEALGAEIKRGRRLWRAACAGAPRVQNIAYRDTLKSIGGFFKQYDFRLFACRIPCDIDYQLCCPVDETLQGVLYLNTYLRGILAENSILRCFDSQIVVRLLQNTCPDYVGLLINLCEPVLTNAVGLVLLGKSPMPLQITADDRAALLALLEPMPKAQMLAALAAAAQRVCRALLLEDAFTQRIAVQTAQALYPRISVGLAHAELSGIFVSLAV